MPVCALPLMAGLCCSSLVPIPSPAIPSHICVPYLAACRLPFCAHPLRVREAARGNLSQAGQQGVADASSGSWEGGQGMRVGPWAAAPIPGVVAQRDAGGVVEHRPAGRSAGLQEVSRDEGVRRVEVRAVGRATSRVLARVHLRGRRAHTAMGSRCHGVRNGACVADAMRYAMARVACSVFAVAIHAP